MAHDRTKHLGWLSLFTAISASDAQAQIDGCFDEIPGLPSSVGTPQTDIMFGTPNGEGLCGLGGGDLIDGRDGDDFLSGGQGNDTLSGGGGADFLDAGAGNDSLLGGAGVDFLDGGAGNDSLNGGAGADIVIGGPGDDLLYGYQHGDVMIGGDDDDLAVGAGGSQEFDGGAGNDSLFGSIGMDTYDGGPGDDLLSDSSVNEADVYRYSQGDGNDVIDDPGGTNVLKLVEIPSSLVSTFPLPNNDLAVLVAGSGLILVKDGVANPITVEHCQKPIDVDGSTADLEICGDDLTQPGATATLRLRNGPANATALLIAGTSLGSVAIPGTDTFLAPSGSLVVLAFPSNGSLDLSTPASAAGAGVTVYTQVVSGNGIDLEASNAVEVKL